MRGFVIDRRGRVEVRLGMGARIHLGARRRDVPTCGARRCPETRATMQDIFAAMRPLLLLALEDERFRDPASRAEIGGALALLEGSSAQARPARQGPRSGLRAPRSAARIRRTRSTSTLARGRCRSGALPGPAGHRDVYRMPLQTSKQARRLPLETLHRRARHRGATARQEGHRPVRHSTIQHRARELRDPARRQELRRARHRPERAPRRVPRDLHSGPQ